MPKNNMKSVRLSDEILDIVIKYPKGKGFNEKFEAICLDFRDTIPERKKELKELNDTIRNRQKTLASLEKSIYNVREIEFDLKKLVDHILKAKKYMG